MIVEDPVIFGIQEVAEALEDVYRLDLHAARHER